MKAITVGMIIYFLICAVLVGGISLYQELKRKKAWPPDEADQRDQPSRPRGAETSAQTQHDNSGGQRAA
jgi:hypothetical protein